MNSLLQANMHRLQLLASLFILSQAGLVRVPKIYNALISSDKELTPSHAIPVVEPVIRTTALGVAFPPIFIHPSIEELKKNIAQKEQLEDTKFHEDKNIEAGKLLSPHITYHGSLYPVAIDPYHPYSYTPELVFPTLPYYNQPVLVNEGHFHKAETKEKADQIVPATNFRKNPDIPDVPPPPLPIKGRRQFEA